MGKVSAREIHLLESAKIRKENIFPLRKVEKATPSNALSCEVVMKFRSAATATSYFPVSVATFKRFTKDHIIQWDHWIPLKSRIQIREVFKKKNGKKAVRLIAWVDPPLPRSGQENVKISRQVVIFGVILFFFLTPSLRIFSQSHKHVLPTYIFVRPICRANISQ